MSSAKTRQNFPPNWFLKIDDSPDISHSLKVAEDIGFAGIITGVINPEYKREFVDEQVASNQVCFTRSPLILGAQEWLFKVIPYLNPPNLGVNDEELRANNESQFFQELGFAFHLKNDLSICVKLTNSDPEALGLAVRKGLDSTYLGKILVELPMTSLATLRSAYLSDVDECTDVEEDQWKVWNKFHAATGYSNRVEVALVMTSDLPSDEELKRWLGEHVGMLIIPHTVFMTNKSNLPVLSKPHANAVGMFVQFSRDCKIAIEPRTLSDHRTRNYGEYVEYVIKNQVDHSENSFYDDNLRFPLQPLHDNLDTGTYEVFEMDPAKYILYQRAIEAAMTDKISEAEKETKRLVLMLLGAGRGPLIRAALNACKNTGRKLKILVVEKNPNAVVTLTSLINVMWPNENITLISKDMRKLDLNEKADIIVSELLGSFGDNELSPECLDGAQHLLKEDGISIPCSSTSYLRPVSTTKILNMIEEDQNIRNYVLRFPGNAYSIPKEMNWLVKFSSVYYIDKPKELFKFVHPNHDQPIDNSRYRKLHFKAKIDCVLHGFSGYFTAKLYKDIEISILPESHTQGMASWFPIFFPADRCYLKQGESISIEFWRKVDPNKVWYEWKAQDGKVANKDGINHPILM